MLCFQVKEHKKSKIFYTKHLPKGINKILLSFHFLKETLKLFSIKIQTLNFELDLHYPDKLCSYLRRADSDLLF